MQREGPGWLWTGVTHEGHGRGQHCGILTGSWAFCLSYCWILSPNLFVLFFNLDFETCSLECPCEGVWCEIIHSFALTAFQMRDYYYYYYYYHYVRIDGPTAHRELNISNISHCEQICATQLLCHTGEAAADGRIWHVRDRQTPGVTHEPIRWDFSGQGGGTTLPLLLSDIGIFVSRYTSKSKTQKAISNHFEVLGLLIAPQPVGQMSFWVSRSHPEEEGQQDNWDSRGRGQGSSEKEKAHPQHCSRLGNTPTQQEFTCSFTELMER